MTPNELRLGNFVKLKDSDKIVRVSFLSNRKIGFYWNADKTLMYYRKYSEIEPVLIYDHWQKIDCPTLNCYDDNTKTSYYGGFTLHKGVRYIHELQNLHFALTGEELKIEL